MLEFIRDMETNDAGILERMLELFDELISVGFFHNKDNIRPLDKFRSDRILCVMIETRR